MLNMSKKILKMSDFVMGRVPLPYDRKDKEGEHRYPLVDCFIHVFIMLLWFRPTCDTTNRYRNGYDTICPDECIRCHI